MTTVQYGGPASIKIKKRLAVIGEAFLFCHVSREAMQWSAESGQRRADISQAFQAFFDKSFPAM